METPFCKSVALKILPRVDNKDVLVNVSQNAPQETKLGMIKLPTRLLLIPYNDDILTKIYPRGWYGSLRAEIFILFSLGRYWAMQIWPASLGPQEYLTTAIEVSKFENGVSLRSTYNSVKPSPQGHRTLNANEPFPDIYHIRIINLVLFAVFALVHFSAVFIILRLMHQYSRSHAFSYLTLIIFAYPWWIVFAISFSTISGSSSRKPLCGAPSCEILSGWRADVAVGRAAAMLLLANICFGPGESLAGFGTGGKFKLHGEIQGS